MRTYSKAAVQAHGLIIEGTEPLNAWNEAISTQTLSESSRKKVCPRETFLGLAYGGYLKGVSATGKTEGVLRERAIAAAGIVLNSPDITKKELSKCLDYEDKQGAYDMVLALSAHGLLQYPK